MRQSPRRRIANGSPWRTCSNVARIFITGSADGLGRMAGELLLSQGHQVVLHARNQSRNAVVRAAVPGAEAVVTGDLSSMAETHALAKQLNALGTFDAVIHNAGIGYREPERGATVDGLPLVFAVNTMAPYLLTALMHRPKRLVYLSSGLHRGGDPTLNDLLWETRRWNGQQAYSDSKLHDVLLAFAVAARWPDVFSNAVHPGWVATKMGGAGASDDLEQGHRTQAWLATSEDPAAQVNGRYFYHLKELEPIAPAIDPAVQNRLLEACATISGVDLPTA